MAREYSIRPHSDWDDAHRAVDSLARDVLVTDEAFDIGLVDQCGNKIVARERREPVGFIRWPEK